MPYDPERHGPHRIVGPGFHEQVFRLVAKVPRGRVTTYGDLAASLGSTQVARQVGFALAALPAQRSQEVPWHRVVLGTGVAPRGEEQAERLRAEGVEVGPDGEIREFASLRYRPRAIAGRKPASRPYPPRELP